MTLRHKDLRLEAIALPNDIIQIRMSNRWSRLQGFMATCHLAGNILLDTGFSNIETLISQYFSKHKLTAIACTHCHEDHAGNAGILAKMHDCAVYLTNPKKQWSEGVGDMRFYRRLWWGKPPPYTPSEMPEEIRSGEWVLKVVPTPGHSATQVAFFEEKRGILFSGDLYVSEGITATLAHENPYETIRSLRRVASLSPTQMISSHGLIMDSPASKLLEKADRIEQAAQRVMQLHSRNTPEKKIVHKVFSRGQSKDWLIDKISMGEFTRLNFVRSCIRHPPHFGGC